MKERTKLLLEKYQIRKTKEQKNSFIEYATEQASALGYPVNIEEGSGAKNIVIGKPESAKVIFTAHYDTCPVMPFPNLITPKNILIYLLYQMLVVILMLALPLTLYILLENLVNPWLGFITFMFSYFGLMAIMLYGPANKHTANDNTSGVATIFEIMESLPEEYRESVLFILFDLEERGLVGSSAYRKKHKAETENIPLINFDCVSDGKHILLVGKKTSASIKDALIASFESNEVFTAEYADKGVIYPSDQKHFPLGIGVSALKRTEKGLLYTDKIHTPKDTVFEEENIDYLKNSALKLVKYINGVEKENTENANIT